MKEYKKTLNTEQYKIFTDIIDNINYDISQGGFDNQTYLITGQAGTGKSFLSANIIKYFISEELKIQCTALTHKALEEIAKKIKEVKIQKQELNGLSTVHSYFKIKPKLNYKTGLEEFVVDSSKRTKSKPCDILFIDEVSMLSPELWKIIKSQSHLYKATVLIGDEYQIPNPSESDENFNIFSTQSIKKYTLQEIVRQAKDNPIIQLSSEIVQKIKNKDYSDKSFCIKRSIDYSNRYNEIQFTKDTKEFIQEYYNLVKNDIQKDFKNSIFSDILITTFTNKTVDSYNAICKCIFTGCTLENVQYLNVGDVLVLQEPAFDPYIPDDIIYNNNTEIQVQDLEDEIYEGIPVYIVHIDDTFIRVIKPEGEMLFDKKVQTLANQAKINSQLWRTYYDFKKKFVHVKQAFACTTHKAQGSTYKYSFVDYRDLPWSYNTDLAFRLCYVAITRASEKVIFKN